MATANSDTRHMIAPTAWTRTTRSTPVGALPGSDSAGVRCALPGTIGLTRFCGMITTGVCGGQTDQQVLIPRLYRVEIALAVRQPYTVVLFSSPG